METRRSKAGAEAVRSWGCGVQVAEGQEGFRGKKCAWGGGTGPVGCLMSSAPDLPSHCFPCRSSGAGGEFKTTL